MKRPVAALLALLIVSVPVARAEDQPQVDLKKAAEANAELALAYMRDGDLATAREKLEKALDQDSSNATTQLAAGFVYDRLGEDKKAQAHFEEALKLSRNDPNMENSYGVFLCRKGDKKRGESYLLQAASSPVYRTPEIAYGNAGQCARADGRPKDAEKYYRQSLAIKADQPAILFEMADVEHELGNELQARAFLERYTSQAKESAAALWLGYRIERALGDNQQAAIYAGRIRKDFPTSAEMDSLTEAEKTKK